MPVNEIDKMLMSLTSTIDYFRMLYLICVVIIFVSATLYRVFDGDSKLQTAMMFQALVAFILLCLVWWFEGKIEEAKKKDPKFQKEKEAK